MFKKKYSKILMLFVLPALSTLFAAERAQDLKTKFEEFNVALRKTQQALTSLAQHYNQDDEGKTPLLIAIETKNSKIIQQLLNAKADCLEYYESVQGTPLTYALKCGCSSAIISMIAHNMAHASIYKRSNAKRQLSIALLVAKNSYENVACKAINDALETLDLQIMGTAIQTLAGQKASEQASSAAATNTSSSTTIPSHNSAAAASIGSGDDQAKLDRRNKQRIKKIAKQLTYDQRKQKAENEAREREKQRKQRILEEEAATERAAQAAAKLPNNDAQEAAKTAMRCIMAKVTQAVGTINIRRQQEEIRNARIEEGEKLKAQADAEAKRSARRKAQWKLEKEQEEKEQAKKRAAARAVARDRFEKLLAAIENGTHFSRYH